MAKQTAQPALRKARIKKGEQVQVISGKAKGQTGEVLRVNLRRGTVLVKDLNMVKRHTKPRRQGESGGIIPMEGPIHLSNVLKYCESCGRGVRKAHETPADCKAYQARRKQAR
jgi:large subunit ribosomal protein L24